MSVEQLITQGSHCMPWLTASNESGSTIGNAHSMSEDLTILES
jgi:hypothetical protein